MKNTPLKKEETLGKEHLLKILDRALKAEIAARDRFLAHAELIKKSQPK